MNKSESENAPRQDNQPSVLSQVDLDPHDRRTNCLAGLLTGAEGVLGVVLATSLSALAELVLVFSTTFLPACPPAGGWSPPPIIDLLDDREEALASGQ